MAGRMLLRTRGSPLNPRLSSSCTISSSAPSGLCTRYLNKDESRSPNEGVMMMGMIRERRKRGAVVSSAMKASLVSVEEDKMAKVMDLQRVMADIARAAVKALQVKVLGRQCLAAHMQMLIQRTILNFRFFTLIAVAGSLIGSVICFVEGCFLIMEAYFKYFFSMSPGSDRGDMMHLVIEAIDMFLIGTGMVNFGMAIYTVFIGSSIIKRSCSNMTFFGCKASGILYQAAPQPPMGTKWVSHAKSRLGRAVVMILQAGTMDKFKSVPLATGMDLACFAGAIFLSAATVFVLSKLQSTNGNMKLSKDEGALKA